MRFFVSDSEGGGKAECGDAGYKCVMNGRRPSQLPQNGGRRPSSHPPHPINGTNCSSKQQIENKF